MRTIILGNTRTTQKVFDNLIYDSDEVVKLCKSYCCTYASFRNGDIIQCFSPNESIRGHFCNVLYVPSTMSVAEVDRWEMMLSHGQDIDVVVYRINKVKVYDRATL